MVPACWGNVLDAPASALESKWCSSSDIFLSLGVWAAKFLSLSKIENGGRILEVCYYYNYFQEERSNPDRQINADLSSAVYIHGPPSMPMQNFDMEKLKRINPMLNCLSIFYLLHKLKKKSYSSQKKDSSIFFSLYYYYFLNKLLTLQFLKHINNLRVLTSKKIK